MRDILFEVKNNLAVITLNRPSALNALNDAMFLQLREHLLRWEKDNAIQAVLVRSNCEKAFCAGGDIRAIYDNKNKPIDQLSDYFRIEYEIDKIIFHYSKPYIALLHGITMGGGVGISLPASFSVAAENLRWAMPETMIGFFPDVGATYYLSRLPNCIGTYLALTGNTINAKTALQLNLIKKSVPYSQFDALEKKLSEPDFLSEEVIDRIINSFSQSTIENKNDLPIGKIAACFCFNSIEEIFSALEKEKSDWAQEILAQLMQRSPISLKVTLKQLEKAKNSTFDEVIAMDLHIARVMLENHDFFEGVRAAVIDKDKNPQWQPARLDKITEEVVNSYFISSDGSASASDRIKIK